MKKENSKAKQNQEIEEVRRGWQRTQADFENYRRRAENEKADWIKEAKIDVLVKILPTLDNLSRALNHAPKKSDATQWIDGLKIIVKQIPEHLAELSIEKILPNVGDELDPYSHEAIATEITKGIKDGCITRVELEGYKIGETVIRPAKVIVAKCEK